MPIAFLSRFEKQFISYRNALPSNIEKYLSIACNVLQTSFKRQIHQLPRLFCGYCKDTLFSALLYLATQKANSEDEEKKEQTEKNPTFDLSNIKFDDKELKEELLNLFQPLCQPKEIVKMSIEGDVNFHSLVKKKKISVYLFFKSGLN
ncbi:hypothetical protein RFI_24570 [Reticulomyxa filosa]|uniref:Uncharacterized protein n=1 Tax=Reticulomyxa filosa TaxID=46433 RepID=X6MFY1_RETFI|nr:hypothetical protein RFI_24570 [Reticulomyxa filosa]|eukprot:ETO12804.1 hypothetical protein RFI_24570 [Reticulomyxa filosa]